MKHIVVAGMLCAALPSNAAIFTVSNKSDITLTKTSGGQAEVKGSLAPGLVGKTFELDEVGDLQTFSFLKFTVECPGGARRAGRCDDLGTYDIVAELAFDSLAIGVGGRKSGAALRAFGKIVDGNLTWTGLPKTMSVGNGQPASIRFDDASGFVLGKKVTTTATVTLGASPVPLPAAGLMLGAVLAAMGYAASRRRQA